MRESATIIIAARNAEATIKRAVASACAQGNHPILLVDDFSTDNTVTRALDCADRRLRVVRPPIRQTLGAARQTGLASIETPYGVWLDADDEFLPGRVECLIAALKAEGSDLASDEVELFDGPSGAFREVLCIPQFLKGNHPFARLFERNYLPGIGVVGFRTDFARRIGYDSRLHGAEDMDFALRAVMAGARFSLIDSVGYRQHAYPASLSRQIANQRMMYCAALRKHEYENVSGLFGSAGHDERVALWGLVSMAIFREEYMRALTFIAELEAMEHDPKRVYEPDGPCPLPEEWRIQFHRGTVLLLMRRSVDAVMCLEESERLYPSAEGANNLGVALRATGDLGRAMSLFAQSLGLRPGYLDPRLNMENDGLSRVTTHPLRLVMNRRDYPVFRQVPATCAI